MLLYVFQDAIMKVDAHMTDTVTDGEVDLQFERESINFKGKISNDAASISEMKHVAHAHLTYPNMRLDMQFDGNMFDNRRNCGGEIEFNYLTNRDGMKKMSADLTYDKNTRQATFMVGLGEKKKVL